MIMKMISDFMGVFFLLFPHFAVLQGSSKAISNLQMTENLRCYVYLEYEQRLYRLNDA